MNLINDYPISGVKTNLQIKYKTSKYKKKDLSLINSFNSDKIGDRPADYFSVKELVKFIGNFSTRRIEPNNKSCWSKDQRAEVIELGYKLAITWGGRFKPTRCLKDLNMLTGLMCIGFHNLSPERLLELLTIIKADQFSHIVFVYPLDSGFKVVVRIDCTTIQEYEAYFLYFSEYYQKTYGVTESELDQEDKDVCQLCYMPYDPNVYYNPESEQMFLSNHGNEASSSTARKVEVADLELNQEYLSSIHTDMMDILDDKLKSVQNSQQKIEDKIEAIADLLEQKELLLRIKSRQPVIFSAPLISREGVSIILPGTINVIQGKYGQHKSRLAEMAVSLLLAKPECPTDFAGFEKLVNEIVVCYLDTERNTTEEFPYALQSIQKKAGYTLTDEIPNFRFTSLKDIAREERLNAIESFLRRIRQTTQKHLFVVLDVVTDCISSFNDERQSMKLIDFLNNLCENYNSTFLVVIHENPSNEKARGHIGTEIANKASTVMQISIDKESGSTENDLIRLRYLKLRGNKQPADVFFQFSSETKGLVLADAELVSQFQNKASQQDDLKEIADLLPELLTNGPLPVRTVHDQIMEQTGLKDSSVRTKVKKIKNDSYPLQDGNLRQFRLNENGKGRNAQYILESIS